MPCCTSGKTRQQDRAAPDQIEKLGAIAIHAECIRQGECDVSLGRVIAEPLAAFQEPLHQLVRSRLIEGSAGPKAQDVCADFMSHVYRPFEEIEAEQSLKR